MRYIERNTLWKLIEVSRGKHPATVWITGGIVFNVYTGELEKKISFCMENVLLMLECRNRKLMRKHKL
ncbi:hypothetical protein [Bacillus sp. BP-3]|uniref:hypothetical protein n=1 Tax=Bacillus sp. BP-3 TaxID=3022773 RepID=UPI00232BEADD|nr:hypothetical protein [Bacillus sp. BP-3]